jgi:hypothetical protein
MRIWYVVDSNEYWLEPDYKVIKDGRVRLVGARLYSSDNQFKGYWHYADWPRVVQRNVRVSLDAHLRREKMNERIERVKMRSYLGKTKD